MAVDPDKVRALFLKIIELPELEWGSFLDRECANHPDSRDYLQSLLDARMQGVDSSPESDFSASRIEDPTQVRPSSGISSSGFEDGTVEFQTEIKTGVRISDRYVLKKKIGEGGMGEVWIASQTEPVKRKVALKLIKAGMDSKAVLSRFEQERQALAMMDHPNIAKVLDAGITKAGQPFFAMELIQGAPLTRYCDDAKLSPRERLELFATICNAIQHAHQKGIIHRDLKPANILVTTVDGKPIPKIIDFGVAKATGGKLTDDTLATQFGAVIGTLEYMSPEQAGLTTGDIDTRSDIYSLGVILYELLTGLRPFDSARLKRAAITEMIRIIQEEEPSKPSTRLSTDESLPSQAAIRQIEPRKLMAILRGELDWIVLKCLEKSRDRRYETATGLSRDIERYLSDEPVEARPPSTRYKIGKFYRRNKIAVISGGLVAISLLAGMVTTSLAMFDADRQRGIAETKAAESEASRLAEEEQRKAAEKANLQAINALNAFTSDLMENLLGSKTTINDTEKSILENARKQWEVFADAQGTSIEAQKMRAQGSANVSKILYKLGMFEKAIESDRRTLEIWRDLVTKFPKNELFQEKLGNSYRDLGATLRGIGRREEALGNFQKAIATFLALAEGQVGNLSYRSRVAGIYKSLGNSDRDRGNWKTSEEFYLASLEIQESLLAEEPDSDNYHAGIADAHWGLAFLHKRQFHLAKSTGHYKKAISKYEALRDKHPKHLVFRQTTARLYREFGVLFYDNEKDNEGAAQIEKAIPIQREIVEEFPSVPEYSVDLSQTLRDLANVYGYLRKFEEGDKLINEALEIQTKLVADFPSVIRYQAGLGLSYRMEGDLKLRRKRPEEAIESYGKAIKLLISTLAQDRTYTQVQEALGRCYAHRAESLDGLKRHSEAVKDWEEALKLGAKRQLAVYRNQYTDSLLRSGKVAEAVEMLDELSTIENSNSNHWFRFAKLYAIASVKLASNSDEYVARSVELLNQAIENGFNNLERLKADDELLILGDRDDFKAIIKALEEK